MVQMIQFPANRKGKPVRSEREDARIKTRPTVRSRPQHAPRSDAEIQEMFDELGIKTFKREYKRLRKITTGEGEDFTSQGAAYALTRSLLAMVIQAMPVAEEGIHRYRNERAIYGANALIASARELSNDLRTFGDQSETINRVREAVVQDGLRILATHIVGDLIQARQELHGKLPPKTAAYVDKRLRLLQESFAQKFTRAEADSTDAVKRVLTTR